MGLIGQLLTLVFGDGRNALRETVEVFRENAEGADKRDLERLMVALSQHGSEFGKGKGAFNAVMDGVNRLPRPLLAFGTIGLFIAAMVDPLWFAERMQGLALVPQALWWLMGAVVSFYFGARHQMKGQQFQRDMAETLSRMPLVLANSRDLRALDADLAAAPDHDPNPALDDWRASRAG